MHKWKRPGRRDSDEDLSDFFDNLQRYLSNKLAPAERLINSSKKIANFMNRYEAPRIGTPTGTFFFVTLKFG